jgi:hypothetical protein
MVSDNFEQERPLIKPYANLPENESNDMRKLHKSMQKK